MCLIVCVSDWGLFFCCCCFVYLCGELEHMDDYVPALEQCMYVCGITVYSCDRLGLISGAAQIFL